MRSSMFIPEKYFLYAEDDLDDQELLTQIIRRLNPSIRVICRDNGLELMHFLESMPAGEFLPCCIVLDMNMPMWNGLYTLEQLRKQENLQQVPIIMFTTSAARRDAERSLAMGAEAFFTKPMYQREMEEVARRFSLFCEKMPHKKSTFHLS